MKKLFSLLVLLMLGYVGFVFWHNHTQIIVPEAAPPVETVAAATPTPVPKATVAPTPYRNLAPAGTYYLLTRVSFMTDSGVIGDSPGTKVTLVRSGTPMTVTDGRNQFDVESSQVTNDLDLATRAYYAVQGAQARIAAMNSEEAAAYARQQEADLKAWQAKQRAATTTPVQPLPVAVNPLDVGPSTVSPANASGNYRGSIH